MELEHDVYDPSLTSYTYFIHNDTDQPTGVFGASYAIQRKDGGGWTDLAMKDGVGWDDIGYTLEPGQTMALSCGFWLYEEAPAAGEYRLVKEVDGALLTAEFSLGESPYTAQTPYGFGPLEDLPERYGAADAAGTGRGDLHRRGHGKRGGGGNVPGEGIPGDPLPAEDRPGPRREHPYGHRCDLRKRRFPLADAQRRHGGGGAAAFLHRH